MLFVSAEEHTFSHNRCTSTSANCLQVMRLSIHPSKVGIGAASDAGEILAGSGALPTSSILVSMIVIVPVLVVGLGCG